MKKNPILYLLALSLFSINSTASFNVVFGELNIDQNHYKKLENYYGQEIKAIVSEGLATRQNSTLDMGQVTDKNLKQKLNTILNSVHSISNDDEEEDKISPLSSKDSCDNCYEHTILGYRRAREILFGEINKLIVKNDSEVFDYYCSENLSRESEDSYIIPNSSLINTEHLWPKSNFGIDQDEDERLYNMMVSDLHHILPTDPIVNRDRYNYPFGEVIKNVKEFSCLGPKLGKIEDKNDDSMYFEPPSDIKGDIARSLFYFATKYNRHIEANEEAFLRKWHTEDPVSAFEIEKNNIIHHFQGVRNPFVDYPSSVDLISDF